MIHNFKYQIRLFGVEVSAAIDLLEMVGRCGLLRRARFLLWQVRRVLRPEKNLMVYWSDTLLRDLNFRCRVSNSRPLSMSLSNILFVLCSVIPSNKSLWRTFSFVHFSVIHSLVYGPVFKPTTRSFSLKSTRTSKLPSPSLLSIQCCNLAHELYGNTS